MNQIKWIFVLTVHITHRKMIILLLTVPYQGPSWSTWVLRMDSHAPQLQSSSWRWVNHFTQASLVHCSAPLSFLLDLSGEEWKPRQTCGYWQPSVLYPGPTQSPTPGQGQGHFACRATVLSRQYVPCPTLPTFTALMFYILPKQSFRRHFYPKLNRVHIVSTLLCVSLIEGLLFALISNWLSFHPPISLPDISWSRNSDLFTNKTLTLNMFHLMIICLTDWQIWLSLVVVSDWHE